MWPSPCKLFLDIESEEDVVRRRTTSGGDNIASAEPGNGGDSPQPGQYPRGPTHSISPTTKTAAGPVEARLVRERLFSFDVAESRPVVRQPPLFSWPVRSLWTHSDPDVSAPEKQTEPLYGASSKPATEERGQPQFLPADVEPSVPSFGATGITPSICSWLSFQRTASPPIMVTSLTGKGRSFGMLDPSQRQDMCCNFCKRNGERKTFYTSHILLDRQGRVRCPVLRSYVCPICKATGDNAHTVSYCPFGQGESTVLAARTPRKSCGCKRSCKHDFWRRH